MMSADHKPVVHPDITGFFAAMSVAAPSRFMKYQAIVSGMCGTSGELSRFPFAELGEHYKKVTGCDFEKSGDGGLEDNRGLLWPYVWCCANRYWVDAEYRKETDDASAQDVTHPISSRVRGLARNRKNINGDPCAPNYDGVEPHPKWVIEAVARIGSPRFNDGKAE